MGKNQKSDSKADFSIKDKCLFEISFEVVNKVGGIHTVLTSKISALLNYIPHNHYFLVGPYFKDKVQGEFLEKKPPLFLQKTFKELETEKIFCHFGEWLVRGSPSVILFDFSNIKEKTPEIKRDLWERFGIDSLRAPEDFDDSVLFGFVVGRFFEKIQNPDFILHFHEWQSGSAILYLLSSGFPTIFTTHSTVLGRTLAEGGVDIYSKNIIDVQKEALSLNISAKHSLEKAVALNADVFTTVSEITAEECTRFLGRKPEVILPNGLAEESFLNFEDLTISHRLLKGRLNEFLFYHFFPYYSFNIKRTLYYFFVGRYEFQNKGLDIFIEALSKLNQILKKEKGDRNIVAFFWAPVQNEEIRSELSGSREIYLDIKDDFEEVAQEVEENFLYYFLAQKPLDKKGIFGQDFISNLERKIYRFKKEGRPLLSSHQIDEEKDPIIKTFKKFKLSNRKEDKVRVVLYPIYLTGHDGLLNMTYREALIGSHLGVFPSFYEPWGYTPLETAALGVCSVTSDVSGFGRFIENNQEGQKERGIFILRRKKADRQEIVDKLTKILYDFSQFSKRERIENKINARQLASLANWNKFILNYLKAYELSFKKKN